MRALNVSELCLVSGGAEATVTVSKGDASLSVTVKGDGSDIGGDLTKAYDGVVDFVSHVIERVADSIKTIGGKD